VKTSITRSYCLIALRKHKREVHTTNYRYVATGGVEHGHIEVSGTTRIA